MKKNILFISSETLSQNIIKELILEIPNFDCSFVVWANKNSYLKTNLNNAKKIYLGPRLNSKVKILFFCMIAGFLSIYNFFRLVFFQKHFKLNNIVCLNRNEKIIFSPIAKLLKIKLVWLENHQDCKPVVKNKGLQKIYYKWPDICLTFDENSEARLKSYSKNLKLLNPGSRLNRYVRQETIFFDLAKANQKSVLKKYFNIGVVTKFTAPNQVETLLQAIKKCKIIIPNIQVIMVGDGEDKKNFFWASKKMEIENLVWLVGPQEHLGKWFQDFDIFVFCDEKCELDNLEILIKAMASKLPIITFEGRGFENLISLDGPRNNVLIGTNNSEILAQEIIKLYKDKRKRLELGEANYNKAINNLSINVFTKEFINTI